MIPACPPRFLRLGLVVAAFAAVSILDAAYAAAPPTQKAEVLGGVFVEVGPDGQLKLSTESDNPIPLRGGLFAIKQDDHWRIDRLPRNNVAELSAGDFEASWQRYLNQRVLVRSIPVRTVTVRDAWGDLPGDMKGFVMVNAFDQSEALKYMILNCGRSHHEKGSGCTVDVSGYVESDEFLGKQITGSTNPRPRLVDAVFTLKPPQAATMAKGKK